MRKRVTEESLSEKKERYNRQFSNYSKIAIHLGETLDKLIEPYETLCEEYRIEEDLLDSDSPLGVSVYEDTREGNITAHDISLCYEFDDPKSFYKRDLEIRKPIEQKSNWRRSGLQDKHNLREGLEELGEKAKRIHAVLERSGDKVATVEVLCAVQRAYETMKTAAYQTLVDMGDIPARPSPSPAQSPGMS